MARRKYSHQPCYILLNSHRMVIGAHFRRLAVCEMGVQEAWGRQELLTLLPPDKCLGMSEEQKCKKLEARLKCIGFTIELGEVKHAYRL